MDLVREAEHGLLDFVTFEDDLGPVGRLDAVLVAARVAPLTSRIGLVPTIIAAHTEPFHLSKAIATLDYVATGRFIDRDNLHHIDFVGERFSVKGLSITPRPPQDQPPVAVLSHGPAVHALARRSADIVFTTPHSAAEVRSIGAEVEGVLQFADVLVDFGPGNTPASDAFTYRGGPAGLVELLLDWHAAGAFGFRLRPAALPEDLRVITREVVPLLQERGVFRTGYTASTLRGHLGLPRPANRCAA